MSQSQPPAYILQPLESHYEQLFVEEAAHSSNEAFQSFIQQIVADLSWGLKIDLSLMERDLADATFCDARQQGTAVESLKEGLLYVAECANYKAPKHPDWSLLAGRIEIVRLRLQVPHKLIDAININPAIWRKDEPCDYYGFVNKHADQLQAMLRPERDFDLYFFGVRTLEKSYLVRLIDVNERFIETPQMLYLRIAIFLWMPDLNAIKTYYDLLSNGLIVHSSPTMFHAGINKGSLGSCFLLSLEDSIHSIFKELAHCGEISKAAGGIGLDVTNIRHSGVGVMGQSSGLTVMLKMFNAAMCYVDQAGRRKGSATIFAEPWHIDFMDFIQMKLQNGAEELRARELFYAVWCCDLFMKRFIRDEEWTMFCPNYAKGLHEATGETFERMYEHYERELPKLPGSHKFVRKIKARAVAELLTKVQCETGMPFMTHKDTANLTSNQQNLGVIHSSNLCVEVMEVTDKDTISACNLANIPLDEFVVAGPASDASVTPNHLVTGTEKHIYDFAWLGNMTRYVVRGLNRAIHRSWYPLQHEINAEEKIIEYLSQLSVPVDVQSEIIATIKANSAAGSDMTKLSFPGKIKHANLNYRPLGLGVQALADTFLKMNMAWTDKEAVALNRDIFATIYYHAVDESCNLVDEYGTYNGFEGSPASKGLLKFDLIARERARKQLYMQDIPSSHPEYDIKLSALTQQLLADNLSPMYNWQELREKVKRKGLANSLLIALMPTASSAQIRYKNESFEPFTTNMYIRSVLSGNHYVINRYMVSELEHMGLWTTSVINMIMKNEGSIQFLSEDLVADDLKPQLRRLKEKCKTAFELDQKLLVDMAATRAFSVCQSQSLNIHMKDPTRNQLYALHYNTWIQGLSTGMYYLRTAPSAQAVKFTVTKADSNSEKKSVVCTDAICISCQ